MRLRIRPLEDDDLEAVVRLSLAAWEPVFESFRQAMGPAIYGIVYPDWEKSQRECVEGICHDREKYTTWVAEVQGAVVGFTGGDPGHAPARRTYEKAGCTPLPLVRYYQDLREL